MAPGKWLAVLVLGEHAGRRLIRHHRGCACRSGKVIAFGAEIERRRLDGAHDLGWRVDQHGYRGVVVAIDDEVDAPERVMIGIVHGRDSVAWHRIDTRRPRNRLGPTRRATVETNKCLFSKSSELTQVIPARTGPNLESVDREVVPVRFRPGAHGVAKQSQAHPELIRVTATPIMRISWRSRRGKSGPERRLISLSDDVLPAVDRAGTVIRDSRRGTGPKILSSGPGAVWRHAVPGPETGMRWQVERYYDVTCARPAGPGRRRPCRDIGGLHREMLMNQILGED